MTAQLIDLGGPGAGCSALRVRRWLQGELEGAEAEREAAHVRGCARCQATEREVAEEQRALRAQLPFDDFAAGVAERLAVQAPAAVVSLSARRRWRAWGGVILAAAGGAIVLVTSTATFRIAERERVKEGIPVEPPAAARTVRPKGGEEPSLALFVLRQGASLQLGIGEHIAPGDRLLVVLPAPPRPYVVVALREGREASLLFQGPARAGPLPTAFEWTGDAPRAQLVALYTELPVDGEAFTGRLRLGERPAIDARDVAVLREVLRR